MAALLIMDVNSPQVEQRKSERRREWSVAPERE
jgi:hypothetical protein